MSTNKGTSINDQNNLLKKKWGGNTAEYDINNAVNNFAKNLEEFNAANTLQQRKDELNALYGGNILNYKSGADVYADYKRDLDQINTFDSYASALQQRQDAAKQAEAQKVQYVDTRRQLMQKYLPETLIAQGVANTGYTADALLKAENNYNQYVLGAMNERAQSEQNAMQDYQNALNTYKMQRADQEYQDFLARQEKKEQDALKQEAKAEQDALKQETKDANTKAYMLGFISDIDNGADIDSVVKQAEVAGLSQENIDKLKEYENQATEKSQTELYNTLKNSAGQWTKEQLAENKQYLTDEQYNSLLNEYYWPANTSTKVGVSATNYGGKTGKGRDLISPAVKNDGFTIDINGDKYALKTGENEPRDSEVFNYAFYHRDEIADGQVFMYDGKLYVKNGTAIQTIKFPNSIEYKKVVKYLSGSN